MWWYRDMMHRLISLIIIAIALAVTGCSSIERLDPADVKELGQISVSTASSRSDQIFHQNLIRYLDRHQKQDVRYQLATQIKESKSDTSVSMTVGYKLYDQNQGEVLISDSINVSATFGAVSSLYGQDKSATYASERLAMQLADIVYLKILAFFNNQEHAGG